MGRPRRAPRARLETRLETAPKASLSGPTMPRPRGDSEAATQRQAAGAQVARRAVAEADHQQAAVRPPELADFRQAAAPAAQRAAGRFAAPADPQADALEPQALARQVFARQVLARQGAAAVPAEDERRPEAAVAAAAPAAQRDAAAAAILAGGAAAEPAYAIAAAADRVDVVAVAADRAAAVVAAAGAVRQPAAPAAVDGARLGSREVPHGPRRTELVAGPPDAKAAARPARRAGVGLQAVAAEAAGRRHHHCRQAADYTRSPPGPRSHEPGIPLDGAIIGSTAKRAPPHMVADFSKSCPRFSASLKSNSFQVLVPT